MTSGLPPSHPKMGVYGVTSRNKAFGHRVWVSTSVFPKNFTVCSKDVLPFDLTSFTHADGGKYLKSSLLFQAAISIASGGDQVFFICPKPLEYRPYHVEGMPEFSPLVLQCVKMIYIEQPSDLVKRIFVNRIRSESYPAAIMIDDIQAMFLIFPKYIEQPSDLLLYLCEFHTSKQPAAIMRLTYIQYYVSHLSQEQSKEAAMVKLFAMLEDTVAFINQKNERCRRPVKKFNSKKVIFQVLLDPGRWLMSYRSSTTNQTTVCNSNILRNITSKSDHFIKKLVFHKERVALFEQILRIQAVVISMTASNQVCYKGADKDGIFLGDLNAKHPSWGCTTSNTRGYDLLNAADNKALTFF
ncbi:hypothetical protein TNIN_371252 [Trichonephila inaurata madagascariensis]|uniref:Endonuclease/exonuclease/phosphatase domain-containing protein n=1 Tax=Trichonephila inaurata madagascariensis TaxID=2747483 RepID=A0A8X6JFQ8_9ARAC|nr:hypothetical protein TNIN_371252 [Trichonephila inaurata madagascariensis]